MMEYLHTIFLKLLAGEISDFDPGDVSRRFERLARRLFHALRPGYWYDGVVELRHRRRKEKQIIFTGRMWVADGARMWEEEFEARLTDMRTTKQGIRLVMQIGDFTAEGELYDLEHGLR